MGGWIDKLLAALIAVSIAASAVCFLLLLVVVGRGSVSTMPAWVYAVVLSPLLPVGALLIRRHRGTDKAQNESELEPTEPACSTPLEWERLTRRSRWIKALVTLSTVGVGVGLCWVVGVAGLMIIPIGGLVLFILTGHSDPPAGGTFYSRGPGKR